MRRSPGVRAAFAAAVFLACAGASRAAFEPWPALEDDSWISFSAAAAKLTMHTVNGGDYAVGFDQAAAGPKARGMNALRFSYGGEGTGHLVSSTLTGSFEVKNLGNARTFTDLVLVVAIDASALPVGFTMSLGPHDATPYVFDPATDFVFYDHPTWDTGRPSGYYSATRPTGEPVSYLFDCGMVTVYAAQGVNVAPSGGSVMFDYAFTALPGAAVFSVYGFDAADTLTPWMYHTNRAVPEESQSFAVSTFAVTPEPGTLALVACGAAALLRRRSWRLGRRT